MPERGGVGGCQHTPETEEETEEYLQQKTEKFHLFGCPEAPKNRQERDRQMEKKKKIKACVKTWIASLPCTVLSLGACRHDVFALRGDHGPLQIEIPLLPILPFLCPGCCSHLRCSRKTPRLPRKPISDTKPLPALLLHANPLSWGLYQETRLSPDTLILAFIILQLQTLPPNEVNQSLQAQAGQTWENPVPAWRKHGGRSPGCAAARQPAFPGRWGASQPDSEWHGSRA